MMFLTRVINRIVMWRLRREADRLDAKTQSLVDSVMAELLDYTRTNPVDTGSTHLIRRQFGFGEIYAVNAKAELERCAMGLGWKSHWYDYAQHGFVFEKVGCPVIWIREELQYAVELPDSSPHLKRTVTAIVCANLILPKADIIAARLQSGDEFEINFSYSSPSPDPLILERCITLRAWRYKLEFISHEDGTFRFVKL